MQIPEADLLSLAALHENIVRCRKCDKYRINVSHPESVLIRGTGRRIFVIGIEPGNTELQTGVAFSGVSGKRLRHWLYEAGLPENSDTLFRNCFFTSLRKCKLQNLTSKHSKIANRNCFSFLEQQLKIVCPSIVVTLGAEPLATLLNRPIKLDDVIGRSYSESDFSSELFRRFDADTRIVPLPHPSPLSRWSNSELNRQKLEKAINRLRSLYERH